MEGKSILYKLRIYLIISVLSIFIVTIFIIGFSSTQNGYTSAQKLAEAKAKDISNQVKNYIDQASGNANIMAESFKMLKNNGNATRKDLSEMLYEFLEYNDNYLSTWTIWEPYKFDNLDASYITHPIYRSVNGSFKMCYYKINDTINTLNDPSFDETAIFYQLPKQTKKHVVTDPYFFNYSDNPNTEYFETSIITPILEEHEFIGAVGIDIDLKTLQNIIKQTPVFREGNITLITDNLTIAVQENDTLVSKNLRNIIVSDFTLINNIIGSGKSYSYKTVSEFSGKRVLRIFAPIEFEYYASHWSLIVEVPLKEVYHNASLILYKLIFIGIISLIIMLFLTTFFAKRITSPILSIIKYAKRVTKGNFSKTPDIEIKSSEIHVLNETLKILVDKVNLSQKLANVGFWEFDFITKKFTWSDQVYRICEYNPKEFDLNANNLDKYIHPDDWKDHDMAFEKHINEKVPFDRISRVITKSGSIKYVNLKCVSYYDKFNNPNKTIGVIIDVTDSIQNENQLRHKEVLLKEKNEEFIRANEKLKESNAKYEELTEELMEAKLKAEENDKLKSAFLANMSHEIRTPLNGLLGFTSLLVSPGISDNDREQYKNIIDQSGKQLLNIIEDILNISRIETGQIETNKKNVNICDILSEIHDFFILETKTKGLKFELFCDENLNNKKILTDSVKLSQILNNLISNAIKFTYQGEIIFGCKLMKDELLFYVKDTGIGISKDDIEIIFERFIQAEKSLNRKYGGTGLGLSIAKAFVEKLEGKIWVDSEENEGSTFYFTIPFVENGKIAPKNIPVIEEKEEKLDSIKVLVAEDEETNYLFLENVLESLDLQVEIKHAWNGEEAVTFVKDSSFDLVLMDIKMPRMNGFTATKEIKKLNPELPVIAQTAYAMKEDRQDAIDAGCDDYISKPIDKDKLISIINTYLSQNVK